MKNLFSFSLLLSLSGVTAFAVVNPSSLTVKVYGVAVSTSADCSSPIVVFSNTTPTAVDFVKNPVLGTGDIADGTYQCVMITISDQVTATPANTEGSCTAGTAFTTEVCQSTENTNLLTGTTIGATTACTTGDDKVTLYLHAGTTKTSGGSAFLKPTTATDTTNGFALATPWVISGTTAGKFYADFTGKILSQGTPATCGVQPATFGFK